MASANLPTTSAGPLSSTPIPQTTNATYLPTTEAYDRWAATYDTDSNPLQALDDLQLQTLLPRFIDLVTAEQGLQPNGPSSPESGPFCITDLGCGTGRNTAKLLSLLPPASQVMGLDASENMLAVARSRCDSVLALLTPDSARSQSKSAPPGIALSFARFDAIHPPATLQAKAQSLISTLVLEHLPLSTFFAAASSLIAPGGLMLLTNMHPSMGSISQAGFKDPATGEKVRPVSYNHSLDEMTAEAERWGWEIVEGPSGREGEWMEAEITEELVAGGKLGRRAGKWVGVKCWVGGILRKVAKEEDGGSRA